MAGRARKKRAVKAKAHTAPIIPDRPAERELSGKGTAKETFGGVAMFQQGLAGDRSRQQCLDRIPEKVSVEVARFPPKSDLPRGRKPRLTARDWTLGKWELVATPAPITLVDRSASHYRIREAARTFHYATVVAVRNSKTMRPFLFFQSSFPPQAPRGRNTNCRHCEPDVEKAFDHDLDYREHHVWKGFARGVRVRARVRHVGRLYGGCYGNTRCQPSAHKPHWYFSSCCDRRPCSGRYF